jgi:hypothetical protein
MSDAQDKYLFYVLGGPGTGKTKIMSFISGDNAASLSGAREFEFLLNKISMLNFDSITLDSITGKMVAAFTNASQHPHPEKTAGQIGKYKTIRKEDFYQSLGKSAHIYMDDHGDISKQDREFLAAAKNAGYKVILVHVTVKPDEYLRRQYELGKTYSYDPMKHIDWALKVFKAGESAFSRLAPMADKAFILERNGESNFIAHRIDSAEKLNKKTAWKNVKLRAIRKQSKKYGP